MTPTYKPILFLPVIEPPPENHADPDGYYATLALAAQVLPGATDGKDGLVVTVQSSTDLQTHSRLFAVAGGLVSFEPHPSIVSAPGTLHLEIWLQDYNYISYRLPGLSGPVLRVHYGNVEPSSLRAELKTSVEQYVTSVLQIDSLLPDSTARPVFVDKYLDAIIAGQKSVFVSGGTSIGRAAAPASLLADAVEFTLRFEILGAALLPTEYLLSSFWSGGARWSGHPLRAAMGNIVTTVITISPDPKYLIYSDGSLIKFTALNDPPPMDPNPTFKWFVDDVEKAGFTGATFQHTFAVPNSTTGDPERRKTFKVTVESVDYGCVATRNVRVAQATYGRGPFVPVYVVGGGIDAKETTLHLQAVHPSLIWSDIPPAFPFPFQDITPQNDIDLHEGNLAVPLPVRGKGRLQFSNTDEVPDAAAFTHCEEMSAQWPIVVLIMCTVFTNTLPNGALFEWPDDELLALCAHEMKHCEHYSKSGNGVKGDGGAFTTGNVWGTLRKFSVDGDWDADWFIAFSEIEAYLTSIMDEKCSFKYLMDHHVIKYFIEFYVEAEQARKVLIKGHPEDDLVYYGIVLPCYKTICQVFPELCEPADEGWKVSSVDDTIDAHIASPPLPVTD